ncbi:MAG: hypothetical protein NT169_29115 [Chloroflexi bacterium]|nr:hypothetical protein [Chloroflexota bacterium]
MNTMRECAWAVGGECVVESQPGRGTRVRVIASWHGAGKSA